jgi:hypothetical protein
VITVFERIPDYFIERYNEELCAWGENFSKIGPVKSIVLKEGRLSLMPDFPGQIITWDREQGPPLKGVKLIAKMERQHDRVTVAPQTEVDEQIIARHCEKMQRFGWAARLFDKEPQRPGLPFMPNILPFPGRMS